jgi:[CysO sulfur-carrier protein]-S-L-cysteine hydrolase
MKLTVRKSVRDEMLRAARAAAPLEACGLLAGENGRATKCYVLANADASPEHYSMKPEEQFAAINDMRRHGLRMLAIWHSHPASPARMSVEDLRLAYTPDLLYVIVSLAEAGGPQVRAFAVRDDVAHETPVTVEDSEARIQESE